MDLRVLKYFLTVAREERIAKATDVLYITQPTLSRQIAELENEVGTALFIRSNRNVTLTDAGILFRCRAEEMLALEEKSNRNSAEKKKNSAAIAKYVDYLYTRLKENGLIGFGLGDWLEAGSPHPDIYSTPVEVTDKTIACFR